MRPRPGEQTCSGPTAHRESVNPRHVVEGVVFRLSAVSHDSPLFDFIESCLRNKNEMVVYEAASAIVHMPNCTARELAPAVSGQNACLHA